MRRRTTLLFNVLSIHPGFLGNLRRLVGLLDRRRLVLGRRALLELVLLRSRRRRLPLLASLVRRGRTARVRLPFPLPPEAPAAPEVKVKEPGKSRPDGTTLPVRVGGCLAPHWRRWQAIGAESWVVTVLRDGYRVPFLHSPPPLSRTPVSFPTYGAGSPRAQALRQEIKGMLAKGALEIARDPGPGFYSRLFLVEKASGGWRPVIDLSHLNEFVQLASFKMETVASVLLSVREGDFLASLDLKDTYFQIPIYLSSRKLLRFTSEGTVYQFRELCFGLSTAPQVFRVFVVVSAWAHSHGIRLLRYLDDWLVLSSSEREAKQAVQSLLSLCRTLGIVINEKKSDLVPSQTAKYLGMTIDTEADKVFPSLARVEKFLTVAESFCTMDAPRAQLWQVILGHLASLERLVPHGRLRMRSLQWHLKAHWSPKSRPSLSSSALATGSETGPVLVDGEGPSLDGGSIRDTCSGSSPVFGRALFGMGRSPSRSTCVRGVVRPGEVAAHQSSRNEGSFRRPSGIPRRCHRSSRDSDVRQLDGRGVPQQSRGHGFPGSVLVDQPPSEMDGEFRHPSRCEVSTRTGQRPGRRPQPSRASSRNRVVFPPSVGEVTASCLGQSVDRPLCDVPQRETAPVLLASPGSPGRLRGCVSPSLGRPGSLCVPSLSSGRSGDCPCPRVVACRNDSGSTPLAREGVVRRLAASTDPTTSRPALVGQSASAAPLQPLPPRRPRAEPSLVATLKRHFRKSGFSGRAAGVLSGCLRSSTSRLYQSRWQIFCGWCRGRGVAPVNATVPVVVDFLIHLRHDKGLSLSAFKGYSSALIRS